MVNTGHRHPKVIEAVKGAARSLHPHLSPGRALRELCASGRAVPETSWCPAISYKKTVFVTTGAEAVENAIKIARAATGPRRRRVVLRRLSRPHLHGHGADRQGVSLQGRLRRDAERCLPRSLPGRGCMASRSNSRWQPSTPCFKADVDPARVAAIILEPVQGEGGFYEVPAGFLQALARDLRQAWHPL